MKDLTISPEITIRQAMKVLSKTAEKCLLLVDDNQRLLGTLTDGDLRRSILKSADVNASIESCYYPKPSVLMEGKFSKQEAGEIMITRKLELLPILNDNRQVVGYITWEQVFGDRESPKKKTLTAPVVIMAGGKGARLEPFTKVLPKPLVPIHDKPVIEHIIEKFTVLGCNEFYLTVNYKSRILKAYFEELQPDYKVKFIDEQEPLGTAGSLQYLVREFNEPFIVTNCDIIIEIDYADLYGFHQKNGYDITLVASMKNYIIPYGTCVLNGDGDLDNIKEKPEFDFLVNTGLYVVDPEVLRLIPEGKLYHITHLITDTKDQGKRVGVYPIDDDDWIDVGQWAEYRKALGIIEKKTD